MRMLFPVGMFRTSWYNPETKTVMISKSKQPSIWKVVFDFCNVNSDCYSIIACGNIGDDYGVIRTFELANVNGILLSIGVGGPTSRSLSSIHDFAGVLSSMFNFANTSVIDAVLVPDPSLVCGFRNLTCDGTIEHRPIIAVRTCNGWTESCGEVYLSNPSNFRDGKELSFGFSESDLILASAPHFSNALTNTGKIFLTSAEITKIRSKIVEIPHGISDCFFGFETKRGKNVGLFGRLSALDKGVTWILDAYQSLYRSLRIEKVFVTTPIRWDLASKLLKDRNDIQVKVCGSDYATYASQCRCSILDYSSIACPMTMMELMAMGVVPIVPANRVWAKVWFSKYMPDFPFMFKNESEAVAMCSLLCSNDALFEEWSVKCSMWANGFKKVETKRKLYITIRNAVLAHRLISDPLLEKDFFGKVLNFITGLEDGFSLDTVVSYMEENKIPMMLRGGIRLCSPNYIHRFLLDSGFCDRQDSIVPSYERVKK